MSVSGDDVVPPAVSITMPHIEEGELEFLEHLGYSQAMIAGALAGLSEHLCMFPVDTVKTRLQVVGSPGMPIYRGVRHAFQDIVHHEGPLRLYRGLPAILLGAIPSHAAYFATYELVKDKLGGRAPGHHPVLNGLAGAAAVCAHDAIVTPLDVIKQRLQVYSATQTSMVQCIRRILQREGPRVLFSSYPVTVAMNVPFQSVHFATYESVKLALLDHSRLNETSAHMMAGACAGVCGGVVSTPFDVVKTRIQTRGDISGFPNVFRQIVQQEGYNGLFKGCLARCMYFAPSAAICWGTYEGLKKWLVDP